MVRILRWVSKNCNENRLREAVQLRQGFPALGSERIGLVQDGGNATLLREGWQGNLKFPKIAHHHPGHLCTGHSRSCETQELL